MIILGSPWGVNRAGIEISFKRLPEGHYHPMIWAGLRPLPWAGLDLRAPPPPAPESGACCHQLSCLPAGPAETRGAPGAATGFGCELSHVTVKHDVNPLRARRSPIGVPSSSSSPEPPSHHPQHCSLFCKYGSLGSFPLSQDESTRQLSDQIL